MEALSILRTEIDRRMSRDTRRMAPFRVRNALPWLAGDSIGLNIRAVAQSIGVSERSLHRDLVIWTGLRPKLLARILRFQSTLTHNTLHLTTLMRYSVLNRRSAEWLERSPNCPLARGLQITSVLG
jgi:hypothetical protein